MHYVATHREAKQLVEGRSEFWVADCGCRESVGGCSRSRLDLCLHFVPRPATDVAGMRQISLAEARAILGEASERALVARPFRDALGQVEGICLCCECCCAYFRNADEVCGYGAEIEVTDRDACSDCGACVPACYFGARAMADGHLVVRRDQCYGCGLCVDACEAGAIVMVQRPPA
jgi:Pyruvate/2-oxoacid:ferredoxin oxidoreductase delta subunit